MDRENEFMQVLCDSLDYLQEEALKNVYEELADVLRNEVRFSAPISFCFRHFLFILHTVFFNGHKPTERPL